MNSTTKTITYIATLDRNTDRFKYELISYSDGSACIVSTLKSSGNQFPEYFRTMDLAAQRLSEQKLIRRADTVWAITKPNTNNPTIGC